MEYNSLTHHGILGMKWGRRRYQNKDGSLTAAGKKRYGDDDESIPKKKTVKDLSDAELQTKIRRLELEKRYNELSKDQKKVSKGKAFVSDVLEKSGKNIATQLTTYAMGAAVNKLLGSMFGDAEIVNPKKGQKDK